MKDLYEQLEFEKPTFLENPYGIKIYIGTKGKDDWCVVIPKKLVNMQCRYYNCYNDYAIYFITEKHALETAKAYTELARKNFY